MSEAEHISLEAVLKENKALKQRLSKLEKAPENKPQDVYVFDSSELFKALVTETAEIIYVISKDGQFVLSEGKGLSKLGLKPGEVVGRSVYEMYKDYPEMLETMKACLEGETISDRNFRVGPLYFRNWYTPFLGNNNEIVGLLGLSVNITEQALMQQKMIAEKEFTEKALDVQHDTFFLFDVTTGKAVRWNKAFHEISGYTDEEIASLPAPASYYSEEDLVLAGDAVNEVMEKGTATVELELICKDGTKIPTEYRVAGMTDETGSYKYLISVGRDISARKQAENALSKSEKRLRSLIDHLDSGIVVHAPDTSITQFNPRALSILGVNEDQMLGKQAMDSQWKFLDSNEETLELDSYPVNQVLNKKEALNNMTFGIIHSSHHEPTWVLVNAVPIFDRSGAVIEVISSFIDITEQTKTADELKKYHDGLEELIRERTEELEYKNKEMDKILKVFVGREQTIRNLQRKLQELKDSID